MAEHDTPATGQHRQPGWYWVRWHRNGFWFPVKWFRGHDGQAFWVGGRAGHSAAEVGSRIREVGEDQHEGYTMRDDTLADRDNLAARFVPRATRRAIVKDVMGALAGKAAADAHEGVRNQSERVESEAGQISVCAGRGSMPKFVVIDKIISSNSDYGPEISSVLVKPDEISSIEELTTIVSGPRTLIMVGHVYYVTQRSLGEITDALKLRVLPED